MDEKRFEELIQRLLEGRATREETDLVEKWLDHRSEKDPFGRLPVSQKEEIRHRIFEGLTRKIETSDQSVTNRKRPVKTVVFYRAAAAIALLSVFTYFLWEFTSRSRPESLPTIYTTSSTSSEGGRKIILSDSSIIWLKGNSSLVYPEKFTGRERKVKLIGEALFEVTKDPAHPFIIQCGSLTAKVLGTSFNIRSSQTGVEVLVLTGKVALSSDGSSNGLIVHPNEKAVYRPAQNHMAKVKAEENEKTSKINGTQYSMQFSATPMREIVRRIEGKFDVQVSVTDERLNNCTITADFTDQSLDRTMSMISQSLKVEYEINDKNVILKGAGCD